MVRYLVCYVLACSWAVSSLASPVTPEGVALVVHFEISSPAYYERYLRRPIWPGGASGVTIGVGYDLGHQVPPVIREDWRGHPNVGELVGVSGIKGATAKSHAIGMRHIQTPLACAQEVFTRTTVPRYWAATRRAFPGVEQLRAGARDALFSVVYNRGTAMAGASRQEMRIIRDTCVPQADYQCIADQILSMRRLWRGTPNEAGLSRRREAEAGMVFRG